MNIISSDNFPESTFIKFKQLINFEMLGKNDLSDTPIMIPQLIGVSKEGYLWIFNKKSNSWDPFPTITTQYLQFLNEKK